MYMTKKFGNKTYYNYVGKSRESSAKKEAAALKKEGLCKDYKIVHEQTEDGTVYWIFTYPKVVY